MQKSIYILATASALWAIPHGLSAPAQAQGVNGYISEIVFTAANFCPRGWLKADGRQVALNQYTNLFSLIGTAYGGDGRTTFALPNLSGRTVSGNDHKMAPTPNYNPYPGPGSDTRVLTDNNLPAHDHAYDVTISAAPYATAQLATEVSPKRGYLASQDNVAMYTHDTSNLKDMGTNPARLSIDGPTQIAGKSAPVPVRDPYLALTACICAEGVYPQMPK